MAAFTCLPLYFAIEWLHFRRKKTALAALALSLLSFIIILNFFQTADDNVIEAYKTGFLAYTDYTPRWNYMSSVFQNRFTGKLFRPFTYYAGHIYKSYAIYCLMLASILAQGCVLPKKKWLATMYPAILIFLASVAPLTMGFFAYDLHRWIFLTIVNTSVLFIMFHKLMAASWRFYFIAAAFFFFFFSLIHLPDGRRYRNIHEFVPFLQSLGQLVTSIPNW